MRPDNWGIYFLADDGALEWAIALLESIRAHAPNVHLWCIPYSDRTNLLRRLERRYGFRVFDDPSLEQLDNLCFTLHGEDIGHRRGLFRKFSAFWGPLHWFLYLDADTLLLDDPSPIFAELVKGEYDLLYAHADLDQVYKPGLVRERMTRDYNSRGINSGIWASRAGLLSFEEVERLAGLGRQDIGGFARTGDQPFLNYCLDHKRVKMNSFKASQGQVIYWNRPDDITRLQVETVPSLGMIAYKPGGQRVTGIHWAGYSLDPKIPYYGLFLYYRLRSLNPVSKWLYPMRRRSSSRARWIHKHLRKIKRRLSRS